MADKEVSMTGVKIKPVKLLKATEIKTENQEQRELVRWVRAHPRLRGHLIKLNNEGKRSMAQGYNLKLMGMEPGASDLFLALPIATLKAPRGFYAGAWIEMKRARKYSPSEKMKDSWLAQLHFLDRMRSVGYAGEICYGCADAVQFIERYLTGII